MKFFSIVTTYLFAIVCFKTVKGQFSPHLSALNLKGLFNGIGNVFNDFGNTIKDAFTIVTPAKRVMSDAEKRALFLSAVRSQLGVLSSVEAATSDPQEKAKIETLKQNLKNTIAGLSLQSTSPISTEEEQQVTDAIAAAITAGGDGGGTPQVQVNMLSDADITIPMATIPATEDGIDDVNPYVAITSLLLIMMMLGSLYSCIRSVTKMRLHSTTAYGYTPIVDQVV